MTAKRHTKQEILELYKACQAKLGKPPGIQRFCKEARLKQSEVKYHWPTTGALTKAAGAAPNKFGAKLSEDVVFQDYARVCIHNKKIPTDNELRIIQRELGTKTHTAHSRYGGIKAFQDRFRNWLTEKKDEDLKAILQFDGWAREKNGKTSIVPPFQAALHFHPFLPAILQYLDVLSRGDLPPYKSSDINVSTYSRDEPQMLSSV